MLTLITILLSCRKVPFTVGELNKPPLANAGIDQYHNFINRQYYIGRQ